MRLGLVRRCRVDVLSSHSCPCSDFEKLLIWMFAYRGVLQPLFGETKSVKSVSEPRKWLKDGEGNFINYEKDLGQISLDSWLTIFAGRRWTILKAHAQRLREANTAERGTPTEVDVDQLLGEPWVQELLNL